MLTYLVGVRKMPLTGYNTYRIRKCDLDVLSASHVPSDLLKWLKIWSDLAQKPSISILCYLIIFPPLPLVSCNVTFSFIFLVKRVVRMTSTECKPLFSIKKNYFATCIANHFHTVHCRSAQQRVLRHSWNQFIVGLVSTGWEHFHFKVRTVRSSIRETLSNPEHRRSISVFAFFFWSTKCTHTILLVKFFTWNMKQNSSKPSTTVPPSKGK